MAETTVVNPTEAENKAALDAAKALHAKGKSTDLKVRAWMDKDSAAIFSLNSRVLVHYDIDVVPNDMGAEVKIYGTGKPPAPGEAGQPAPKRRPIKGVGYMERNAGKRIQKAIKIPTGTENPIKRGKTGAEKAIKTVTIRVPAAMNLNAIVLWINNQIKKNKPSYFISEAGVKCYLDKSYTDKNKLGNLTESAGGAA